MKKIITFLFCIVTSICWAQDVKISAMPTATDLTGTVYIPIIQNGLNKKAPPNLFLMQGVNTLTQSTSFLGAFIFKATTTGTMEFTTGVAGAGGYGVGNTFLAGWKDPATTPFYGLYAESGRSQLGYWNTGTNNFFEANSAGLYTNTGGTYKKITLGGDFTTVNAFSVPTNAAGVLTNNGSGTLTWAASAGGITNTAAANELMKSDATNAVPSGISIPTNGNITLGLAATTGNRTLTTDGSQTDVPLTVSTKGIGEIGVNATQGSTSFLVKAKAGHTLAFNVINSSSTSLLSINQSTGVTTFSSLPTIPLTPSATTDAASKGYVDSQALGPFSTTAPGYTNLSGNSLAILKGSNTWLAPGTALQVLRVNAGATNLEWATISAGGMSNPMTTLGDFIYEDASPAPARLAGNITTTKKFIAQTGNGSISAVPAWSTIVVGDIPLLSGFANGTTPVSTDKIIGVQSGANVYWNLSQFAGYNLITAAGSSLTQRQTIDVYNGLTAADNVTKTDLVLGGPLTVNTTISGPFKLIMNNNLAGALTLNGTWTAAGVTENHVDIIPTITARATASDVIRAVNIAPSLTSAAATQTLTALLVNPTFTDVNSATKYLLRVQNNTTDAFTIQHNGTQNFQASYNSNGGSTTNVSQLFGGTVTYLASSDAAYISLIAPTYNVNSQGGTKAYGYFYNPTITNGTLATHYAFYATSGDLLLATGNETISAGQLTIANGQSQAATFTGKVLVTGNFTTGSAANNILSVQNTNTALYSTVSFDNTANNAIYYSGSTWNPSGTLLAASAMWVTVTGGGGIIFRSDGNGDIVTAIGGAATTKEVMRLKAGGAAIHTQQINTSGSPVAFKLVGGANTTLAASTESSDFYLNLGRIVQFSTGALTLQRAAKIEGPTYGFVGASTLTDAVTFEVIAAPTAGTNATFTRSWAARILGNTAIGGSMHVGVAAGTTAPTALLHLAAGTATASTGPLKFTAGTLLTTPEAFAVESNANSFYQTKNSTLRYGQGGVIFDNIADANNGTTAETDLYTYTTPANTLAEDGDKIVGSYVGTFNDATATVQLKVYFAGTAIGDTGVLTISVTGGWTADCRVIRTSSTTARTIVTIATPTSSGASSSVYTKETDLTSLTLSGTNIIKITGTAVGGTAGSNDITGKFSMGYFFPAAHN